MGKRQGKNNKQAWLDWLADEPPAAGAQAELRERFKQQANSYRPVDRTQAQQPAAPAVTPPQSQASHAANTPPAAQSAAPATVSIQIHIPAFHTARFKRAAAKVKQWVIQLKIWLQQGWTWLRTQSVSWLKLQYQEHRGRTVSASVAVMLLLVTPLGFTLLHGIHSQTGGGSSKGAAAGGTAKKQAKPSYDVVRPSNKPNLATPDGKNAAYDSTRQEYSYRDSIGTNGFIVSQQPVPAKFATGELAVNAIAPTVMKGITPVKLNVITGTAQVATNPTNGSQIVVASVRTLLLFIQSGHQFTTTEWEDYLNTLQ
ncbi:MAG: hypothetical protein ACREGB_05185 [Candidatus Saccharimonadales bacterium]